MVDVSDVVIIVPTIREASIKTFLAAWRWPCEVIVVEDNPEKTFDLKDCAHYAWSDIERDLGDDSWIIPHRSDCIRSYGYWKAWQTGKPTIITLDDDCLPIDPQPSIYVDLDLATPFIEAHLTNLQPKFIPRWQSTLDRGYTRGHPYEQRTVIAPVGISHGLWRGVLDYDSISQLVHGRTPPPTPFAHTGVIPFGQYFPMCGMNLAWRREYTPLMYFLLMGQDRQGTAYPFDRFGDIWCGVIAKKILDHLGIAVYSGAPFVQHDRASNVWANFDKEHAGIKENESFWQWIDSVWLWETEPARCYRQVADYLRTNANTPYWDRVGQAMHIWSRLYG